MIRNHGVGAVQSMGGDGGNRLDHSSRCPGDILNSKIDAANSGRDNYREERPRCQPPRMVSQVVANRPNPRDGQPRKQDLDYCAEND